MTYVPPIWLLAAVNVAVGIWMVSLGWKVVAAWCLVSVFIGTPLSTAFNEKSAGRVFALTAAVIGIVCVLGVSNVGNPPPCAGQSTEECEAPQR